jgi:hypothetical protein
VFRRLAPVRRSPTALAVVLADLVFAGSLGVSAQRGPGTSLGSLRRVAVPQPTDLDRCVRDRTQLVALGKALFWDVQ